MSIPTTACLPDACSPDLALSRTLTMMFCSFTTGSPGAVSAEQVCPEKLVAARLSSQQGRTYYLLIHAVGLNGKEIAAAAAGTCHPVNGQYLLCNTFPPARGSGMGRARACSVNAWQAGLAARTLKRLPFCKMPGNAIPRTRRRFGSVCTAFSPTTRSLYLFNRITPPVAISPFFKAR